MNPPAVALTQAKPRLNFKFPAGQAKEIAAELGRRKIFCQHVPLTGGQDRIQVWAEHGPAVRALAPEVRSRAVPLTVDDAAWFLVQDNKFLAALPVS